MTVSFNQIPDGLQVPFFAVEFDQSAAQQGAATQTYKVLLLGQKLSTSAHPDHQLVTVTSEAQAASLFGRGSMLQKMVAAYLANDSFTELVALPLSDSDAAATASAALSFSGTPEKNGTFKTYLSGESVAIGVVAGDAPEEIALRLVQAIAAKPDMVISAEIDGTDATRVVLTSKHAGAVGNDLDLRLAVFSDDVVPSGLSVSVEAFSGGSGAPDLAAALASLDDDHYHLMVNPYLDGASLETLDAELSDRFGPIRQTDGIAISAKSATLSDLQTFADGQNSPHLTVATVGKSAPMAPWQYAAAITGQVAASAQRDPARPFQTLGLSGVLSPSKNETFTLQERNLLLKEGVSTIKTDASGTPRIERLVTTYKTNAAGQDDPAYHDLNTMLTLSYLRYSFRNRMALRFPRAKLADDGIRLAPGTSQVVTPKTAKAEAVALFAEWEAQGLVEDVGAFKKNLVVSRSSKDPNRLEFLLPPDLINQLRVVAAQIQFRL